jgi:SAM-dependent methyltransferase
MIAPVAGSWTDGAGVFDGVVAAYDARRPGFPAAVFADIGRLTGIGPGSQVVEVGPGTGKATVGLAALGASVVGIEPGPALAAATADRCRSSGRVTVVNQRFEDWDAAGARFDAVVAANSWHWVDPVVRWTKAHALLRPRGWLVLVGHFVVAEPGVPEVYAETADLHDRHAPGHPGWGHPPTPAAVTAAADAAARSIVDLERALGRAPEPPSATASFDPPTVRWHRQAQHLDARGFVELLRTTSLYGGLPADVREPLLHAIEERIRTRMGDRAQRSYLIGVRAARAQPS